MTWIRRVFDFFLFSSIFISLCAVLMTWQTGHLLLIRVPPDYYWFVLFATICSYNFHWYLTPPTQPGSQRTNWTLSHKHTHLIFYFAGVIGSLIFFYRLRQHWLALSFSAILTFLYSAPKIPLPYFRFLKQVAIGKTIFLTIVWTYVTTILPIIISGQHYFDDPTPHYFSHEMKWFSASRFFLVYAICIFFDYRDRADDRDDGIRTLVNYFDEGMVNRLFVFSLIAFLLFTVALLSGGMSLLSVLILIFPGLLLAGIYQTSKNSQSDYLYYFILDGLMMLSALVMAVLSI